MSSWTRRSFIAACARAGSGAATLTTLPWWARQAMSAVPADLIERSEWPEHLETTLEALGASRLTRNDRFFVRSHLPVPRIDPAAWRLEIAGLVERPASLTLAELKELPPADAVYTLECAGNGRGLLPLPSTSGTQWERGAVGTARWGGVRLATLLRRAGVRPEAGHVWLEAGDAPPLATPPFLRSIPLQMAMGDTLLAWSMNGAPLPALHGAPLRAIVPGWYGMASTKWLTRIRLEAAPSTNHFMARGYRYVEPGADPATAPPVEEIRVKSVITRPLEGARLPLGSVVVRGLAWAGEPGVKVVEISTDQGRTWKPAGFIGENDPLAWRGWATELQVDKPATVKVMARATDGRGVAQPLAAHLNTGGYGNNSIHEVTFHVRR